MTKEWFKKISYWDVNDILISYCKWHYDIYLRLYLNHMSLGVTCLQLSLVLDWGALLHEIKKYLLFVVVKTGKLLYCLDLNEYVKKNVYLYNDFKRHWFVSMYECTYDFVHFFAVSSSFGIYYKCMQIYTQKGSSSEMTPISGNNFAKSF